MYIKLKNLLDSIKKRSNIKCNKKKISKNVVFRISGLLDINKSAEIKEGVIFQNGINNTIKIDEFTQIGPYSCLYGGDISIGKFVMIAPHVMITTADHDFIQMDLPMRFAGCINDGEVIIEDDVWIGANVTITSGVKLGKGCVIGANSVVTKDIPPFSVAYGVPAKVVKRRGV